MRRARSFRDDRVCRARSVVVAQRNIEPRRRARAHRANCTARRIEDLPRDDASRRVRIE